MGDKIIAWLWAKMPGLVSWAGGLSEGQLIGAAVGGLLLMYALWTALYNGWLVCRQLWPFQSAVPTAEGELAAGQERPPWGAPRGGAFRRMISAPTRWDDEEPYEEWMAEVWQ